MTRRLTLLLALTALVAAGCGSEESDSDGGTGAPRAGAETSTGQEATDGPRRESRPAKPKGTAIKLAESQYGEILFDREGQAIYLFEKEKSTESACYGECAEAWPPVLTDGEPQASRGIAQRLLGTTKRRDGKTQVTYNGHPLYYYAHEGRHEVRCHNVPGFGGLWLVLDGRGDARD